MLPYTDINSNFRPVSSNEMINAKQLSFIFEIQEIVVTMSSWYLNESSYSAILVHVRLIGEVPDQYYTLPHICMH